MSAPKAKSLTNGTKKSKGPAATDGPTDVSQKAAVATSGRPDKTAYEAEQQRIRAEVDLVQGNLNTLKDQISLVTKGGSGNEKRNALRAELDDLRYQQSGNKASRGRIFDQMKTLQEGIQKRVKDLQAARGKTQFKTVEEVDAHIRNLEKQVDSGTLKLADEKRALQEISQTKRARRTVETFQAETDAIDADRAAVEELKKQLDDPEAKATSERFETIKAELDEIKKEEDELYANRSKLFDDRTALQEQIDALLRERRESAAQFREANDRFYTKLNEDRTRRAERARAQREAEEEEKRNARALRLREEASQPAFQVEIEDCQTLIDHFSGKSTTAVVSTTSAAAAAAKLAGYTEPKQDIRQVEAPAAPENFVPRKKKGEDEVAYFVGGGKGSKGKGKKGGPRADGAANAEATPPSSSSGVNVPFATLSALLSLSIPPPSSQADVPRVVEDLKTKKAWYEANQARVTSEAIAKAEAEIERLTRGKGASLDKSPTDKSPIDDPWAEAPLTTEITDDQPSDVIPGESEVVQEAEVS